MELSVLLITTHRQFRDFIQLPYLLHSDNPNWVPPLQIMVKDSLNIKKNPFYAHAERVLWIAYRRNKPVGRIAFILNKKHNEFHRENAGFWGFFETENNIETASALFNEVEKWAMQKKLTILRGPMNPSMNHECGLQISAYDTKPFIMMTQNPSYYPNLIELMGHHKAKDLHAWLLSQDTISFHPRLLQQANSVFNLDEVTIRYLNKREYLSKLEQLFVIYNEAWEENWGFTPMSHQEFIHLCKEMKNILTSKSILIIEVKGEIAAFGIWIPDINQVLSKIHRGKLFPIGLLQLIWHTKINKKTINQGRIPLLGVLKKFRHLKLGALLYATFLKNLDLAGCRYTECSWILEDNRAMRTGLRLMNAKQYKTYRIYEKILTST